MGKRGPAKKPSALEKLHGNPGKRKPNKKEPKPETGIPITPAWLDGKAKYFFKEVGTLLDDMKVITKADKKALELMADAYSEWREARAFIREHGQSYIQKHEPEKAMIDTDGKVVLSPAQITWKIYPQVKIASDAWRRCMDGLKQFGLTASSRTGIKTRPDGKDKADPLAEFMKRGGKPYKVD